MYRLIRPLLFQLDPEKAHTAAVSTARAVQRDGSGLIRRMFMYEHQTLEQSCLGTTFRNPIGLAAGFDKNAELARLCEMLGFGFTEVGSVTHLPSMGNPYPRMFRLPSDRAVINRMGLNNDGAHAVAHRIADHREQLERPLGINVAKTHDPSILGEKGIRDFCSSFQLLAPLADYVTLNVSCPNTREGTTFEEPEAFRALAEAIAEVRETLTEQPPVLIKLSPPSSLPIPDDHPVTALIDIAQTYNFDGFVATNTAPDRQGLDTAPERLEEIGEGGLSGEPLQHRSAALVRFIYNYTEGAVPIIGAGGIHSPESAYHMMKSGASLLQLYTGLIYEGPGLIRRIKKGLVRALENDGFSSIEEAVGTEAASDIQHRTSKA